MRADVATQASLTNEEHLTIVSALTIGIPGFFLALSPGAPRAHPGFVRRVLAFTVPAGLVVATVTLMTYLVARGPAQATTAQARTAATLVLVAMGLVVLVMVARPLNAARAVLFGCMTCGAALIWAVPLSRRVFALEWPPAPALWAAAGIVVLAVPILWELVGVGDRLEGRLRPAMLEGWAATTSTVVRALSEQQESNDGFDRAR
jgi:cation-transporting P-type ATPase E